VLAKVASAIAAAGCNISNVSVETDDRTYATNLFTVQVSNRMHLAKMMRALRRVQEVVRIARMKGLTREDPP
jgi:GTP diphosphokinase / guanosine-3',5'-bis(diphosphate) 3'-diphosphatase